MWDYNRKQQAIGSQRAGHDWGVLARTRHAVLANLNIC